MSEKKVKIEDILFLDIETAPIVYIYDEMDEKMRQLWNHKFIYNKDADPAEQYKKAGVYSEFAKIICISVGFLKEGNFRLKSFFGDDEKIILEKFSSLLNQHYNKEQHRLCAHNGKEFDFPFIARRMLINGIKLPEMLDIGGKKPWEIKHLDTMELWKFGDYKNYTSLNLLAAVFGIPTPKDDINGSDVARVYWEEKNISRIATYCQKDVLTVAQLYLRMKGEPMITEENIIIV